MDLSDREQRAGVEDAGDASRRSPAGADRDVGQALRSIYTDTVAEDVPDDLLNLLGKLD